MESCVHLGMGISKNHGHLTWSQNNRIPHRRTPQFSETSKCGPLRSLKARDAERRSRNLEALAEVSAETCLPSEPEQLEARLWLYCIV